MAANHHTSSFLLFLHDMYNMVKIAVAKYFTIFHAQIILSQAPHHGIIKPRILATGILFPNTHVPWAQIWDNEFLHPQSPPPLSIQSVFISFDRRRNLALGQVELFWSRNGQYNAVWVELKYQRGRGVECRQTGLC